jgi:hypothetical protein
MVPTQNPPGHSPSCRQRRAIHEPARHIACGPHTASLAHGGPCGFAGGSCTRKGGSTPGAGIGGSRAQTRLTPQVSATPQGCVLLGLHVEGCEQGGPGGFFSVGAAGAVAARRVCSLSASAISGAWADSACLHAAKRVNVERAIETLLCQGEHRRRENDMVNSCNACLVRKLTLLAEQRCGACQTTTRHTLERVRLAVLSASRSPTRLRR